MRSNFIVFYKRINRVLLVLFACTGTPALRTVSLEAKTSNLLSVDFTAGDKHLMRNY